MKGFSLLELVVLIVVLSLLATGLFGAFPSLLQGAATPLEMLTAQRLAKERLELVLGRKRQIGFAGCTQTTCDPCTAVPASTLPMCTAIPSGYSVSTVVTNNWSGDANYKHIKVTVSGRQSMEVETLVANY